MITGTRVLVAPLLSPISGKAIGAIQVTASFGKGDAGGGVSSGGASSGGAAPSARTSAQVPQGLHFNPSEGGAPSGFSSGQEEALVHLCTAMAAAWDQREVMTADRVALRSTSERLKASREDRTVAKLREQLGQAQQEVADLRDSLASSAASTKAWVQRDQKETKAQQERLRRLESELLDKESEVTARLEELEVVRLQLDAKQRETKAVEKEKIQISTERDEVLGKLVQYRKHVKQARRVMEEAMEEEQRKRRTEMESVKTLQRKLEDTQRQMAELQLTYHKVAETGEAEKVHFQSLSAELEAISKENSLLKNQQKVLHQKLKSLATLEVSDLKSQSPNR